MRSFGGEYRRLSYLLVLTTAASFLAQNLPKPLLAASIAWSPITLQSQTNSSISLPVAGESTPWDKLNIFEEERRNLVLKSAGMALLGSSSSFHHPETPATSRRFFTFTEATPVNSSIHELRVPFLMVDKLEWVSNPEVALNATLQDAIKVDTKGMLNISSPTGVMTKTVIGNTGILKTTPWTPAPIKFQSKPLNRCVFPPPTSFTQERYVAVLVERPENPKDDKCPKRSRYFGNLPPQVNLFSMNWFVNDELYAINCYAIAKATIRAGSFRCSNCTVVSRGAAEAILSLEDGHLPQLEQEDTSDPLTLPILDILPEVMLNIAMINATGAQFWNNLDGYTRGMMAVSYQAAWSAMTDTFQGEDTVIAYVFPPEYFITLQIDMRWFLPWLVIACTGILGGWIFIIATISYKGGDVVSVVHDPAFAAVLLDLGKVYERLRTLNSIGKLGEAEREVMFTFDGGITSTGLVSHYETRALVVKNKRPVDPEEELFDDRNMLLGSLSPT
ncbi:hypothetical protein B0T14DRAFT_579355 [Immersiella caudata]|uniref:Transmembrane protein n=1 Tax=Immersiella caudata TaxID=314043 RepID=A0AA39X4T8_9PEZI|nr:hypothetical protein B0T14DRAFT_579355 [Immersiella caudata]